MAAAMSASDGGRSMTSPENLEGRVLTERIQEARERWLGSTALSAEALSTMEEIDELLDRANAEGIRLENPDAA